MSDAQWRPLADALQSSMTETGVEPSYDYVQATAKDSVAWLSAHGYAVVPSSLLTNAEAVVKRMLAEATCCDECKPYIDPERDALAASVAQARGDDSLSVFRGEP